MASIIDCCNETFSENLSIVKILVYAVPIYLVANLFLVGKMQLFNFWIWVVALLFIALLTQGINNVRMNRTEILTFNPKNLVLALVKAMAVLLPVGLIFYSIGKIVLSSVKMPAAVPHSQMIFTIIVWAILFAVVLTSYLSFAKYLKIKEGFNFRIVFESCIDVVLNLLFFIPQLAIVNAIFVGPIWWAFSFFGVELTHWGFVAYCSVIFVINWSILANYFAQLSYEQMKGNNEDYGDNMSINVIDDITNRMN